MDSVRKASEWAGSNLNYVQAWLVSKALNDNPRFRERGGRAYLLDYWTGSGGHGVSLVEEGGLREELKTRPNF